MSKGKVLKIEHTGCMVSNMDKAFEFYVGILGFEIEYELGVVEGEITERVLGAAPNSKMRLAKLRLNGTSVELCEYIRPPIQLRDIKHNDVGFTHIGLEVEGIYEMCDKLKAAGYEIIGGWPTAVPEEGVICAYFRGFDDVYMEFLESAK